MTARAPKNSDLPAIRAFNAATGVVTFGSVAEFFRFIGIPREDPALVRARQRKWLDEKSAESRARSRAVDDYVHNELIPEIRRRREEA